MATNETPVYLFTGFLEGGKTHIIQESLSDPSFNTGEKTLILMCGEGNWIPPCLPDRIAGLSTWKIRMTLTRRI